MYVSGRRGSLEPTIDRKRQLYRKFADYYSKASLELSKEVSMLAPPVLGFSSEVWSVQLSLCLQKENAEIVNNKTLSIVGKKINKS